MSWQAVKAAYAIDGLDLVARSVLVALAFRADSDGRTWPSIDRLATDVSCNRRSVSRALSRLVAAGHVAVIHRAGIVSAYTVDPGLSVPGGRDSVSKGRDSVSPNPGLSVTQNRKENRTRTPTADTTPPGPAVGNGADVAGNGWISTTSAEKGVRFEELPDGTVKVTRT